jgi:hypothetical protein
MSLIFSTNANGIPFTIDELVMKLSNYMKIIESAGDAEKKYLSHIIDGIQIEITKLEDDMKNEEYEINRNKELLMKIEKYEEYLCYNPEPDEKAFFSKKIDQFRSSLRKNNKHSLDRHSLDRHSVCRHYIDKHSVDENVDRMLIDKMVIKNMAAEKMEMERMAEEKMGVEKMEVDNIIKNETSRCEICTENINSIDRYYLSCNHSVHEECIRPWLRLNGSCPICPSLVSMEFEQDNEPYIGSSIQTTSRYGNTSMSSVNPSPPVRNLDKGKRPMKKEDDAGNNARTNSGTNARTNSGTNSGTNAKSRVWYHFNS